MPSTGLEKSVAILYDFSKGKTKSLVFRRKKRKGGRIMRKVALVAALLTIIFALAFSGCTDDDTVVDPIEYGEGVVPAENYEEINFNIADGFFTTSSFTMDMASLFLIATSPSQFKEWCDGRGLPYFSENKDGYDSPAAVRIRETYTDDYFEENALLLIHYVMGSYDTFDVDGLRLSDGILTVVGVRPEGEYDTADVITSYFGILEVAKEDVADVVAINIGFIGR